MPGHVRGELRCRRARVGLKVMKQGKIGLHDGRAGSELRDETFQKLLVDLLFLAKSVAGL
jgi:hypothetical protein